MALVLKSFELDHVFDCVSLAVIPNVYVLPWSLPLRASASTSEILTS